MSSNLTVKEGIYDPTKRFAFTNISDETFTFKWGGNPITVKPKETIELPHHLAVLATGKLVDHIMGSEARADELKMRAENKDPYWRSPKGIAMGVPEARRPYEEKILRELGPGEESPALQVMRAQIKEELQRDLSQEKAKPISSIKVGESEFAPIKTKNK